MNPNLDLLKSYPLERLDDLKKQIHPPGELKHIKLHIGEPSHPIPDFVIDILKNSVDLVQCYPTPKGNESLRQAIKNWLIKRYSLPNSSIDIDNQVLPVNGSREALFSFAQAALNSRVEDPMVLIPNPFYQVYEAATLLANATPVYINCIAENNYLPNFTRVPADYWKHCQMVYLCSPGNPTGAVMTRQVLFELISLALKYDFIIAADECYSEIYQDETKPPLGLLEAAHEIGNTEFKNCVVFNSLSKRSGVAGLRSGFVAGDKEIIQNFLKYRMYHGSAMPLTAQQASAACWEDEAHVEESRSLYQKKFKAVVEILKPVLDLSQPEAGFYLWLKLPTEDDEEFTRELYRQKNVTVLPGSYLSRSVGSTNPGKGYVRLALVVSLEECIEAAQRIRAFIHSM